MFIFQMDMNSIVLYATAMQIMCEQNYIDKGIDDLPELTAQYANNCKQLLCHLQDAVANRTSISVILYEFLAALPVLHIMS